MGARTEVRTIPMKRQKSQHSKIGTISTAVVTATLFGATMVAHNAQAAQTPLAVSSGIYVTILSQNTNYSDPNQQIEISAFYQAAPSTGGVTTLELYIDGQQEAIKRLDVPDYRGKVSFIISPGTLALGNHNVVVRVSTSDAEIASVQTAVNLSQPAAEESTPAPALGGDTDNGSAPAVAIMTPTADTTVTGLVDIKVDAHDNSGKAPYVSLFIDHNFKTLRNFPPFDFAWDTTRVANGYHTIEVWGYNDDQAVGHAKPITVFVNNPGGRTFVRHDLLDTVPPTSVVRPHVAVKPHVSVAKLPPAFAGGQAITAPHVERLASADFNNSSFPLTEETQLMAPFLSQRLPTIAKTAPAAAVKPVTSFVVKENPLLATRSVETANGNDQLSSGSPSDINPEINVDLMAPTVAMISPLKISSSAPVSTPAKTITQVIASASIAPPQPKPSLAPSILGAPYSVQVDAQSETVASGELSRTSLESPDAGFKIDHMTTSEPSMHPVALAQGESLIGLKVGYTRIASASINASSTFSPDTSLLTPTLSTRRVVNFISTRRQPTAIEPLGSSPVGFPVRDVERFQVVLNDRPVLLNQPLQDRNKFLFAPFRQIFESEGGVMTWNAPTHRVHALNSSRDITLTIGSKTAMVNEQSVTLNASPYLTKGHTMIPLAFVPIALNATVSYDPATGHIVINSKD
jgi:hypothetical protein